ncbi:MAG TPA: pyridoxal-phosphate dependent enzyme [Patescibacteria group bacterium]|nr:pyridoxal-phosphate dependent enzyme [Patescibacteria group bacterium]
MSAGPSLDDIRVAARRIAPFIHRTPVLTCSALDAMAGARLYFKCENLQKTGSFKIRGATNAILQLSPAEAARGVVTQSSGNHAAAVSRAASARGIAAHIVMPKNAPTVKCRAVEGYGGVITFCEPTVESRDAATKRLLEETGGVLVHPYNDRRVIAGQGTAALELLEDVPELDVLLVPVSGGGLLSGNAIAATSLRPSVRVIGCEPANADDAFRSLKSGHIEKNTTTDTIADGLRAQLCDLTFSILRERVDEIVRVTEQEIVDAMRLVWERMKIVIEPSSAVALAPAMAHSIKADGKRVGVLLSGGNVELSALPFH